MPVESAARSGVSRYQTPVAVILGLIALLALLVRIPSIAEPLGIDQSLWASAVRGMARGQLLYRDVWEQRPPGIYFIYLWGFHLFGWQASTVAWLDIAAAAVTTTLLYALVRRLADRLTAAAAAAAFAAFTVPSWMYGHGGFLERSVNETFIIACVAGAFWCAARMTARDALLPSFGLGLLSGAAVVLKPNAGLYYPAALLWVVLYRDGGRPLVSLTRPILVSIAGATIAPVLTFVWLWQLGLLGEAKVAVIDFNRYYVSEGFSVSAYALTFSKAVFLRMKTDPLWLSGAIGSTAALVRLAATRRLDPIAGLALIWGGAAVLVIVVNGARLFNSYFINALPPLAVMSAWLLASVPRGRRTYQAVAAVTAVLMITVAVRRDYVPRILNTALTDLAALRGEGDRNQYLEQFGGYGETSRGYSARANEELAEYIREHTLPDDRVFVFGINGAGVYFAADRLTAHRFLRVNFFIATTVPDPEFRLEAVTRQLAERRPRYIVFERRVSRSEMGRIAEQLPQDPLVSRVLENYRLETEIEDFLVYRLAE